MGAIGLIGSDASHFIFFYPLPVGATVDSLSDASGEQVAQVWALRAENRNLRRDIENAGSRIGELETEAFKYIVQK